MNVADEHSRSCWIENAPAIDASPLHSDQMCDVVAIGSGIAGLSTACELCRFGRSVIVIDRGKIGRGMTALVWDTCDAYHYVRMQPLAGNEDLIIVGGKDHHSGEASDMDQRLANLQEWTRKRYPSFTTAKYCWSGQVMEPIDFMPFSGGNPGSRNIYIHIGDSGQGITNGVVGSLTILPLIIGEDSRYAPVLEPRKSLTSGPSLGEFARGPAGVAII